MQWERLGKILAQKRHNYTFNPIKWEWKNWKNLPWYRDPNAYEFFFSQSILCRGVPRYLNRGVVYRQPELHPCYHIMCIGSFKVSQPNISLSVPVNTMTSQKYCPIAMSTNYPRSTYYPSRNSLHDYARGICHHGGEHISEPKLPK